MARPKEPSVQQIVFEQIMFHTEYTAEFDRLRVLCVAYNSKKLTAQWLIMGIRECFRDDYGEDWVDDKASLDKLAEVLANAT
jgi:hypothetical protein